MARAGDPFSASAEGTSADEATRQLEAMLRQRLQHGGAIATIELSNGPPPANGHPFCPEALPEDDWFFKTMREAIEENRQRGNDTVDVTDIRRRSGFRS